MNKEELKELRKRILNEKSISKVNEMFPKKSAYQHLYDSNKDNLKDDAIKYLGTIYTYKQLIDMIDATAAAFTDMGIKAGDTISISMLATPEGIISFYAANKIGAMAHMVNVASSSKCEIVEELKSLNSKLLITHDIFYSKDVKEAMDELEIKNVIISKLTDSMPKCMNMDKAKYEFISALKSFSTYSSNDSRCISFKKILEDGKKSNTIVPTVYVPNKGTMIAYTSGTTGEAKAVVGTDEAANAMTLMMDMSALDAISFKDTMFSTLPLWIYYELVNSIHDPLCTGMTVAIDPIFNASKDLEKRLKQYRFNHWNTIAPDVEVFVQNKNIKHFNASFLKTISVGGQQLGSEVYKKACKLLEEMDSNIKPMDGYGNSETLGCYWLDNVPLVGNRFKIIDVDTGKELGPNQIGELYITSPTLMKEYYGNKELTDKSLITDAEGNLWYKTGDLAHFEKDTNKVIHEGRIRRMAITKDKKGLHCKLIPDKVTKEVLRAEGVYECETIIVPDKKSLTTPVSYIILNENTKEDNITKKTILEHCAKHLPSYMIPQELIFVSEFPLTPAKKVDIAALELNYSEHKLNGNCKKRILKNN